ncbi:rod shape-determining protein RodA [Cupriavidus sp. AU9028]|uniref:rod shape-determining protein RodA n=1 Tax=Cupriavidus sp. AU9028 TaxID=2871157 RepID=UPI001C94F148|nr:rod shape-determining protein RodA [Cupriavidus sp. AU9028]MBY4896787.1 rod shape-determining protein RodA [Cupriavidus sp. AU9028]
MDRRRVLTLLKTPLTGFDKPLALIVFLLFATGIVALYSASIDVPGRVEDQIRNILLSYAVMWIVAWVPTQTLMRIAVPLYTVGIALLIAVAMFGLIRKGARRWLNVGIVIQPSELLKIAVPLMLAWYFQKRENSLRWFDFVVAGVILAVPVLLIAKQPDLGTGLLVLAAGLYVIYFAGLSWKLILPALTILIALITALVTFEHDMCAPGVDWPVLHEYQQHRVCTLLDPTTDPLGKGFHTIQSIIAIGSGGLTGKGWLQGTQTHLEFIPEKHTDFIFAVYSEEFGLVGNAVLLVLYLMLVFRGLYIAANAPTFFARLLAGAMTLSFLTYAFINMGMVSGILPVVGVPLPLISYGGTALVTLGMGIGILMNISRQKRLIQS